MTVWPSTPETSRPASGAPVRVDHQPVVEDRVDDIVDGWGLQIAALGYLWEHAPAALVVLATLVASPWLRPCAFGLFQFRHLRSSARLTGTSEPL